MDVKQIRIIRHEGETDVEFNVRWLQDRIEYCPDYGCWLWRGSIGVDGYGKSTNPYTGKHGAPHRLCYEWFVGPIPKRMTVHHKCYTPVCCNPDHLELMSMADNTADAKNLRDWAKEEYRRQNSEALKSNTTLGHFVG